MSAVTDALGAAAASSGSSNSSNSVQDQQDRFLKLLVTQLQNQDPLNPMDNAEITSQMAQLSTVSGIEKLNDTLASMNQSQSFQAAGLIGHNVVAPGNFMDLVTSGGVSGGIAGFDLAAAADKVTVTVKDSHGATVRSMELGKQDAGLSLFSWDGKNDAGTVAADGTYTFSVTATSAGTAVTSTALAVGSVNSVLMDKTGPKLNVSGMGDVDMSTVREII